MSTQFETSAVTAHVGLRALQFLGYISALTFGRPMALWHKLRDGARRRRRERELEGLSDVVLKDIGVARSEILWIARTSSKPPHRPYDRQE